MPELIKNVSDVVTLSENDHGVAHAISHILESAGKDQKRTLALDTA